MRTADFDVLLERVKNGERLTSLELNSPGARVAMNFKELRQAADAALTEVLTPAGFRKTAPGTWSRRRACEINVVQLQRRSAGGSFCVNLGVHYTFLPKAGTEVPLDGDVVEVPDYEVKLRLAPGPASNDQWWPIAASSVGEVCGLLVSRGLPTFDTYRLDGAIAGIDGKSIEIGNLGVLSSMTKVRACLLIARMHESLGNRDRCIEAATIGVKLAGRVVGPKKAFADILKRLEP